MIGSVSSGEVLGTGHLALEPEVAQHASTQAFQDVMRRAMSTDSVALDESPLRDSASRFVATALIQPALETMHDNPFGDDGPFAPGPGERRFAPLLDQYIADRISQATSFPLVDAIVEHVKGLGRPAKDVIEAAPEESATKARI